MPSITRVLQSMLELEGHEFGRAGGAHDETRPFLGHPIAKKLAAMHGGNFQHGPANTGGTVVTLTLPIEKSMAVPSEPMDAGPVESAPAT